MTGVNEASDLFCGFTKSVIYFPSSHTSTGSHSDMHSTRSLDIITNAKKLKMSKIVTEKIWTLCSFNCSRLKIDVYAITLYFEISSSEAKVHQEFRSHLSQNRVEERCRL
jgi:hypothetical protein